MGTARSEYDVVFGDIRGFAETSRYAIRRNGQRDTPRFAVRFGLFARRRRFGAVVSTEAQVHDRVVVAGEFGS